MTPKLVVASFAMALVLGTHTVSASLGERVATARARTADYAKRFGAVDPIFKTDAGRLIVMECWAAPPEMWSANQAVALGKELLPTHLRNVEPKAMGHRGGPYESFVWGDGVSVRLWMAGDKYVRVEIRADTYTGPDC